MKSQKTKQTVLLKMIEERATLAPSVTISENTADGVAPNFQDAGFLKPDRVTLIENGNLADCLASPRSAKEYGAETNGTSEGEFPGSIDIAAGDVERNQILEKLDTGVYINNVWYLNYSDRPACRITRLTRFACFWVENGEILAPTNVMRFDETVYRALDENLIGLTKDREMMTNETSHCPRDRVVSHRARGARLAKSASNRWVLLRGNWLRRWG
jgi:predicted Zn-dependent protease